MLFNIHNQKNKTKKSKKKKKKKNANWKIVESSVISNYNTIK